MPRYLPPALFSPDAVSPETCDINLELARRAAEAFPVNLPEMRAAFNRGEGAIPSTPRTPRAKIVMIDGSGGHQIALRIVAGAEPVGVFLHIHGGAWIMGRADMRDADLERIVESTGFACVSVEYRLAPEHPYPAAPDDCETAARWLIHHAREQFGTERLVIGGESSGAHLSVVTLLRLRESGFGSAFHAAVLTYGAYDLSMTPSLRSAEATLVLTRQMLEGAVATFLPSNIDRIHPDVSPLYANLSGLPPALFTVGTLDPLLDDSLFMHARWVAAGNEAQLAIYPGGAHGFTTFPSALAREANTLIDKFMVRHIEVSSQKGHFMDFVSLRIITSDIKRLVRFYEQVTSLSATWYTEDFAEVMTSSCTLAIGSTRTMDLFGAGAARPADNHTAIIEFRVDDVDREYEKLKEVVNEFVQEPKTQPWGNRSLLFRDPDGNLINFFTPVSEEAKKKFSTFEK